MRFIHYVTPANSPYLSVTLDEILTNAVLLTIWNSDIVFVGNNCSLKENVNIDYCEANNIPIIRGFVGGRAFLYESGKHLTYTIYNTEVFPDVLQLQTIIVNSLKDFGIDTSISKYDIIYRTGRVSMVAPSTLSRSILTSDLILDIDYDKIEACLKFPDSKWNDKPVDNIRDWIKPLKSIVTINSNDLIQKLRQETERILNISLIDSNLTSEEIQKMENLLPKYTSDEWIKYGRWCPIRKAEYVI